MAGEARRSQLFAAVRGMYPPELMNLAGIVLGSFDDDAYRSRSYTPELHMLDAEWYFTEAFAEQIADFLPGPTLFLGAPSVAAKALGDGHLLVDSSPHIAERFPEMKCRHQCEDVIGAQIQGNFESAVIDPPWYAPHLTRWMEIAARHLSPGAPLYLPLLGSGTRPSAEVDRRRVLDLAEMLGHVHIESGVVEYDIPLFERCALRECGLVLARPWRYADWLRIELRALPRGCEDRPRMHEQSSWTTHRFADQVVKVRAARRGGGSPLIQKVPGIKSFTLPTVSQRDPRIPSIEIWTSRNRVASLASSERAIRALSILQTGQPSKDDPDVAEMGVFLHD